MRQTDIVRPLQLDGHVFVAPVVALDALDHGHGGQVLDEDHGRRFHLLHGVAYHGREHERARGRDPDVGPAASSGDLDGGCRGEAVGETPEKLGVPDVRISDQT